MTPVGGLALDATTERFESERRPSAIGPRSLWMCMTRKCNFACGYCYQGSHAKVPEGLAPFMSDETAEKTIEWSHRWGAGDLTVIWYGGEPMLAFKKIMEPWLPRWNEERAKLKLPRVKHSMTTNGSLLDAHAREFMDKNGVGLLWSLDGPPEFHNLSRPYYDGHGTWKDIPVKELLEWRPSLEIAWQLDPKFFDPASGSPQIKPATLDEMMGMGFRNINFNIQWMVEWTETARWNLFWFFKHATLLMIERQKDLDAGVSQLEAKGLGCNWWGKLQRALTVDEKMDQPCGTGMNMVGVSPEGFIYPSQEMCYTVFEPGRAPGTPEYYRLGDVRKSPVLDMKQLALLSQIKTKQMKPPAPFNCETCIAKSASIGGCHCRYVGDYQGGMDVSNRYDVTPGYCQSTIAVHMGMLAGAAVARMVRPTTWKPGDKFEGSMQQHQKKALPKDAPVWSEPSTPPALDPAQLNRIEKRLGQIQQYLGSTQLVRLETVGE